MTLRVRKEVLDVDRLQSVSHEPPTPAEHEIDYAAAETHEPVATRTPPGGRIPCDGCGAELHYVPGSESLQCPYCGNEQKINVALDTVGEQDFQATLERLANEACEQSKAIAGLEHEVSCQQCGATFLLAGRIAVDRCPFCTSQILNEPHATEKLIAPASLLPFGIDERIARQKFREWVASRWFAPSDLRRVANEGRVLGMYLPYWTYDSMTFTRYSGLRGDNYTTYETYTTRDADGRTTTSTRPVTRIRWTPVSGRIEHWFDDVLVEATQSVPTSRLRHLEPWDLEQRVKYDAAFLSGFRTERYQLDLGSGFEVARGRMDAVIQQLCRRDIGGDHQQLLSVKTRHTGVTFKHLLLPVWHTSYHYRRDLYQVLINGRTGKVSGGRPISWIKVGLLITVVVLLLLAFVWWVVHLPPADESVRRNSPFQFQVTPFDGPSLPKWSSP